MSVTVVGVAVCVIGHLAAVAVRVGVASTVRVTMVVEEKETDDIRSQTKRPDNNNEARIFYLYMPELAGCKQCLRTHTLTRHVKHPLQGFHKDAEAQCQEKDAVDKCAQDLGSLPTV